VIRGERERRHAASGGDPASAVSLTLWDVGAVDSTPDAGDDIHKDVHQPLSCEPFVVRSRLEVLVMTRSRRVLDALVSGFIVYGLMAACSGKTTTPGIAVGAGGAGHGGSGGHAGSGGDSSLFDALTDPVSDALAGVENPQSGTRLKGKFTMGADGSKQYQLTTTYGVYSNFTGPLAVEAVWYDALLQEDCTFLQAADGKLHCLPGVLALPSEPVYGFAVYYADAQCTMPFVAQYLPTTGCVAAATPKYVQAQEYATCGVATTRVLQVGSPAAAPPTAYEASEPGTCGPLSPEQAGTVMGWFSATEVAPPTFVEGTIGVDP
jgi:hypothetical protein